MAFVLIDDNPPVIEAVLSVESGENQIWNNSGKAEMISLLRLEGYNPSSKIHLKNFPIEI